MRFDWYIAVRVVIVLRPGQQVDSRQRQPLFILLFLPMRLDDLWINPSSLPDE